MEAAGPLRRGAVRQWGQQRRSLTCRLAASRARWPATQSHGHHGLPQPGL